MIESVRLSTDDAASKLLYLAPRNLGKKWKERPDKHWRAAFSHLKLLFGDRLRDEDG